MVSHRVLSSRKSAGTKCDGCWRQNFEPLTTGVRKTMTIFSNSTLIYTEPPSIFGLVFLSGWIFTTLEIFGRLIIASYFVLERFAGLDSWWQRQMWGDGSGGLIAGRRSYLFRVHIWPEQSKQPTLVLDLNINTFHLQVSTISRLKSKN